MYTYFINLIDYNHNNCTNRLYDFEKDNHRFQFFFLQSYLPFRKHFFSCFCSAHLTKQQKSNRSSFKRTCVSVEKKPMGARASVPDTVDVDRITANTGE